MTDERRDHLISRVVDRRETAADWRQLERWAANDQDLWPELLGTLRGDAELREALRPALAAAEHTPVSVRTRTRRPWRVLAGGLAWAGWLAAGVLLACWPGGADTGLGPAAGVERGADGEPQIVRELGRTVLEARPADDGKNVEVLYVRRRIERAVVPQVYELGSDEYGRPVPTPAELASFEPGTRY